MAVSIEFYTKVLDFEPAGGLDDSDPSFNVLTREGDRLFLSSHRGDGVFGQAIVVITTDDIVCNAPPNIRLPPTEAGAVMSRRG